MRIFIVLVLAVACSSCSTSASRMHADRAEAEQDRAYRLGQEAGTPENINAMRSAQENADSHRKQEMESDGWSLFEIMLNVVEIMDGKR